MTGVMKISDEEIQDTAFAIGVLVATIELFLEGRMLNTKGEKEFEKAIEIINKYQITDEELTYYFKQIFKDHDSQLLKKLIFSGLGKFGSETKGDISNEC